MIGVRRIRQLFYVLVSETTSFYTFVPIKVLANLDYVVDGNGTAYYPQPHQKEHSIQIRVRMHQTSAIFARLVACLKRAPLNVNASIPAATATVFGTEMAPLQEQVEINEKMLRDM